MGFAERFFDETFTVLKPNFIKGEQEKFYTDIDHDGKFSLKLPILNTQELYLDWKRTRLRAVLEPGDTLFLFVDINDFLPTDEDKKNYEGYIDRPKQILYMGNNSRLNNEIAQYKGSWQSVNTEDLKKVSDMEFLDACKSVYEKRIAKLNNYIHNSPHISEKFKTYATKEEKSNLAYYLMQRRFVVYDRKEIKFPPAYMQYIKANFPLDDEIDYTLTDNFTIFLSDYIGYHTAQYNHEIFAIESVEQRLNEDGKMTDEIKQHLSGLYYLVEKIEKDPENKDLVRDFNNKLDLAFKIPIMQETRLDLIKENQFLSTTIADSLISNKNLKELWMVNRCEYWFKHNRKPLSKQMQQAVAEKVKNPYLLASVGNLKKNINK